MMIFFFFSSHYHDCYLTSLRGAGEYMKLEELINIEPAAAVPSAEQLATRLQLKTLEDPFCIRGVAVCEASVLGLVSPVSVSQVTRVCTILLIMYQRNLNLERNRTGAFCLHCKCSLSINYPTHLARLILSAPQCASGIASSTRGLGHGGCSSAKQQDSPSRKLRGSLCRASEA
jgi:hypothetical protein